MESNEEHIAKSDSEIIENVMHELRTNALQLSKDLGYKSPTSIYHIAKGRNNITVDLAERIVKLYPQVNFLYLVRGTPPIIKDNNQMQQNMMRSSEELLNLNDLLRLPQITEEAVSLLMEIRDLLKNKH